MPIKNETSLTMSVFSFRLFYLFIEIAERYIKEENFFKCCTWLCHTLCGVIVALEFGDSYILSEYDSTIIQRSCAKMPKWILVEQEHSLPWSHLKGNMVVLFVGICMNFVILIKQRHLERQQSIVDHVITYDNNEVNITRKSKQTSDSTLWRYRRNVISPLGSFASFLTIAVYNILFLYILFTITPSGPSAPAELLLFLVHVLYFFCLNLVETIFSSTLHSSLIGVFPWSGDNYVPVIV